MPDISVPPDWYAWVAEAGFFHNSALRWMAAGAVLLVSLLVAYVVKWVIVSRLADFAARTSSDWDDAAVATVQRTRLWFLLSTAAFCGSLVLELPDKTREVVQTAAVLVLLLQAALWGNVLIGVTVSRYVKRRMQDDPASAMTVSALALLGKLVLFSLLLLLALDNMGIDVTALIAGLGVGGIAVALAVQNILGDLLASFSIVFDKPFVLGDFIIVGDQMGTVDHIGIKTTRLRALSGEQLIFSNNDLLASRIRNFKRMNERRIAFSVGVTYQTPGEKLAQIPLVLREIVAAQDLARFDRAHFKEFGDSALVFEVVYYVLKPDFNLYMDVQQAINLAIYERFAAMQIEFAYPTRTIFMGSSVTESAFSAENIPTSGPTASDETADSGDADLGRSP